MFEGRSVNAVPVTDHATFAAWALFAAFHFSGSAGIAGQAEFWPTANGPWLGLGLWQLPWHSGLVRDWRLGRRVILGG